MTCEEFRAGFFDRTGEGEVHRAACPACAELAAAIARQERLLREARAPAAPDLWPAIAARLAFRRRLRRGIAAAAAAAVLALAGTLALSGAPPAPALEVVIEDAPPSLGSVVPAWGAGDAADALVRAVLRGGR
jgi:predicted anti-sigma-YlaC factor YlaD